MKLISFSIGTLVFGVLLAVSAAHADDAKVSLLIKSAHPDGTTVEKKMDIISSTPEEVAAIVDHFSSQVNVTPDDPEDDKIVSVKVLTD